MQRKLERQALPGCLLPVETRLQITDICSRSAVSFVLVHFSNRSVKTGIALVVPCGIDVSFERLSPIRQLPVEIQLQISGMRGQTAGNKFFRFGKIRMMADTAGQNRPGDFAGFGNIGTMRIITGDMTVETGLFPFVYALIGIHNRRLEETL